MHHSGIDSGSDKLANQYEQQQGSSAKTGKVLANESILVNAYQDTIPQLLGLLKAANRKNMAQNHKYRIVWAHLREGFACIRNNQVRKSDQIRWLQDKVAETEEKFEVLLKQKDQRIYELESQKLAISTSGKAFNQQGQEPGPDFYEATTVNQELRSSTERLRNQVKQLKASTGQLKSSMKKQEEQRSLEINLLNDQIAILKSTIQNLTIKIEQEVIIKEETIAKFTRELHQKSEEAIHAYQILREQQQFIESLKQEIEKLKPKQVETGGGLEAEIENFSQKFSRSSSSSRQYNQELRPETKQGISMQQESPKSPLLLKENELKLSTNLEQFHGPNPTLSQKNKTESDRSSFSSSSSSSAREHVERESGSYCSRDKQEDILQVELEIIKCKYKLLQKMYLELKHQSQDSSTSERKTIGVQTQDNEVDFAMSNLEEPDHDHISSALVHEKSLKKTLSGFNLHRQADNKLDISIADSFKGNKNSTALNSPAASLHSFTSFFNSSEIESKIKNYNYQTSILHKINTSKFITSPSSKFGFVFQYACFLELYFSPEFLGRVMEELIMGDQIEAGRIGYDELSSSLVEKYAGIQQNSAQSQASLLQLKTAKLSIFKQYSINSYSQLSQADLAKSNRHLTPQPISSIQNIKINGKIQKIEANLDQLAKFLICQSVDLRALKSEPTISQKLILLSENQIVQLILKLLKQNQAMSKCLNLMMKNQEILTKKSNDVYFQNVQIGDQNEPSSQPAEKEAVKQSCIVM